MSRRFIAVFGFVVFLWAAPCVSAGLIISQYYEGTSSNKWVEITNVCTTTIDLGAGNYKLSGFQNNSRQSWKSNGASINGGTTSLTGTLASGESLLVRNTSANNPSYALSGAVASNGGANFNGDDSVVLWSGDTYSFSNVVDAFGVTSNSFANTSYVRNADVTSGVDTDFNVAEWTEFSLSDVDSANTGTTERLGFHSFTAVPEPSSLTYALIFAISLFGPRRRS